jgi:DNA-binding transcriptional LysR family regulator
MTDPNTPPDMAEADLGLLFALEALLQENNVTRAAARLGVSQPALSARLNRLRHLFNDPLFVPASNGRGVVPTPRALELRDNLSGALGILREMLRAPTSFDPATSRRTFVIAMQEQPAAALAPGLALAVLAEAPEVRLAFIYPMPDIGERLEDGAVDLLVAPSDQGSSTLIGRVLFENDFLTAQRKRHPRGTGPLDLDTFCTLDHLIVSTDGAGFSALVDRTLAGLGRSRRVALSIQSYGLAPLIVARTDCVCTLPSRLLRRYADDLDLFEPPLPLSRSQLVALWHPRSQEDRGHVWLRERLYKVANATD